MEIESGISLLVAQTLWYIVRRLQVLPDDLLFRDVCVCKFNAPPNNLVIGVRAFRSRCALPFW
jgi:hypothetical protein